MASPFHFWTPLGFDNPTTSFTPPPWINSNPWPPGGKFPETGNLPPHLSGLHTGAGATQPPAASAASAGADHWAPYRTPPVVPPGSFTYFGTPGTPQTVNGAPFYYFGPSGVPQNVQYQAPPTPGVPPPVQPPVPPPVQSDYNPPRGSDFLENWLYHMNRLDPDAANIYRRWMAERGVDAQGLNPLGVPATAAATASPPLDLFASMVKVSDAQRTGGGYGRSVIMFNPATGKYEWRPAQWGSPAETQFSWEQKPTTFGWSGQPGPSGVGIQGVTPTVTGGGTGGGGTGGGGTGGGGTGGGGTGGGGTQTGGTQTAQTQAKAATLASPFRDFDPRAYFIPTSLNTQLVPPALLAAIRR